MLFEKIKERRLKREAEEAAAKAAAEAAAAEAARIAAEEAARWEAERAEREARRLAELEEMKKNLGEANIKLAAEKERLVYHFDAQDSNTKCKGDNQD